MHFNPRTPVGCDYHRHAVRRVRQISIHAPQWGATPSCVFGGLGEIHFNPRTPVGCDPPRSKRGTGAARISIHAPQWGATHLFGGGFRFFTLFQSTHPSGVRRRSSRGCRSARRNFNPRTPVGCDSTEAAANTRGSAISIHAPQWGATTWTPSTAKAAGYFNPRTPVGCDDDRKPT